MVTNQKYLTQITNSSGANILFVKTNSDPVAASKTIAAVVGPAGAQVHNIHQQTAQTTSAITTVDLTGISKIEELFTIILAASAISLFILLEITERKQEFATMAALGAPFKKISAFLWFEVAIVLALGFVIAIILGWLLSMMLVAMLQHVFDPPPDTLAIPWLFLLELAGITILATFVSALLAIRNFKRMALGEILREQ